MKSKANLLHVHLIVSSLVVFPLYGMTWQTETVESSGRVGNFPDIAVDSNNYPNIVYRYEPTSGAASLRYAAKGLSGWSVSTIAGSDFGLFNSLLLDNGTRHIASSNSTTTLHYITNGSGTWDFQQVNGILYNVDMTRIAKHPAGGTYIAYRHNVPGVGGRISISNNASGSWQATTLPSSGMSQYVDMAIGSDGVIHVVFGFYDSSISTGGVKYCRSDTGWQEQTVMTSGTNSSVGVAIGVDSANRPHIINRVGNENMVYYCSFSGGAWHSLPIGNVYGASGGCRVLIDANDLPCALVNDSFAATDGSAWRIRGITGIKRDGRMAFDHLGNLHLCSYNNSAYDLIYTKGTPIAFQQVPNGNFEGGETDWYTWGEGGSEGILQYAADIIEYPASSGNHTARIRAFDPWDNGSASHLLAVEMNLPTYKKILYLAFDYQFLCTNSTVRFGLSTLSAPLVELVSPAVPETQMQQVIVPVPWEGLDMQNAILSVTLDVQDTNSTQTEGYGFYLDNVRFLENLPGDIEAGQGVDYLDFCYFAQRWGRTDCASTNGCEGADLDGLGEVDIVDLRIMADYWLAGK